MPIKTTVAINLEINLVINLVKRFMAVMGITDAGRSLTSPRSERSFNLCRKLCENGSAAVVSNRNLQEM